MKRAMNYVRGTVTLTARGLFPERLLNLCAQEGAPCWGVEWTDDHTLRLTTFRHKLSLVKKLAQRAGCEISVEGRRLRLLPQQVDLWRLPGGRETGWPPGSRPEIWFYSSLCYLSHE